MELMKQLDELEFTSPLKTPGVLGECKTTCKAFASPVLAVLSFSRNSWVSEEQLFP